MKIREIYHPGASYVAPAETLHEAAAKMRSHGVSCVPVVYHGQVVGALTERDVVEAVARGVHPSVARVNDYMNDGCVAVSVNDDHTVAAAKMLAVGCRHLPVTDMGKLVGMVSVRDVYLVARPIDAERMLLG